LRHTGFIAEALAAGWIAARGMAEKQVDEKKCPMRFLCLFY
jgi:hypothetical protein